MATLPTSTELKIDSTIMQHIPVLKGQSNYSIWKTCVQSTLQAYLVFEFVDGSLLYTAMTDAACYISPFQHMLFSFPLGLRFLFINDSSHIPNRLLLSYN